ncbi:uracil-DNA glycosylase family protein [Trinickia caryophylli]|uniref:uracil-DNA glycosylase family protein n=1 Tax=Trinickia caryophylli TaxID=28094 RepID=UPI000A169DA0|nr:uracil-DNA glycosylase family protein [Trinickia caryophylli]PMS11198.1 uracil-DNA glycosylase [Trinickia caryophylli]TRX20053.1 uracil-DNA glycosylase family protein [Trinickia caryophylli]WQE12598.1 uracil-DNA glycosylase family protein [Trinickia caryophylli]
MSRSRSASLRLPALLAEIRACRACEAHLPLGPRPVLQAEREARVLVVGQAPGARVHETGIPWNDRSGERLRAWMDVTPEQFYDAGKIAILPMAYCYPGRGTSGDLPPRPECARLWLDRVLAELPHIELTLLVGAYAQAHFLGSERRATLTETVAAWRDYGPARLPLPHPSPRNQGWFKHHPWFERELVPVLRERIAAVLGERGARAD